MAEAKAAVSRRSYKYDHHYGLQASNAGKAPRAGASPKRSSSTSAKAAKPRIAAKKH